MKKESLNQSLGYRAPELRTFTFESEGVLCGSTPPLEGNGIDAGIFEENLW